MLFAVAAAAVFAVSFGVAVVVPADAADGWTSETTEAPAVDDTDVEPDGGAEHDEGASHEEEAGR